MTRGLTLLILVAVLGKNHAKSSDLEQFLTSGFDKTSKDENQDKEIISKVTEDQVLQFMRRAGLIGGDNNQQKAAELQSLNPQAAINYLAQASQLLTNYMTPKRQLAAPQQLQQQVQLKQPISSSTQQRSVGAKAVGKQDRQGYYPEDGGYDNVYTSNHGGGYVDSGNVYSNDHTGGYSGGHNYAPEPVHYKPPPPVYHSPSVAIKIDPLSILRLLLQGIPRPLLNLNGKVFFGVELGKKAGIGKAVGGYAQPHGRYGHQGGGTVISLG